MDIISAKEALLSLERKLYAYNFAEGMIYYDSVTTAPKSTSEGRGVALEPLGEASYSLLASDETRELLDFLLANKTELDEVTLRSAELMFEQYSKLSRVPMDEFIAFKSLVNEAESVWHDAKENDDYATFSPYLQKIIDTNRRFAAFYDPKKTPYNALLSEFEKGLDTDTLDGYFDMLGERLASLVREVKDIPIRTDFLSRYCPIDAQRRFSDYLMETMGIDRSHCAIGETEHPFTINFNKNDVRITTHYRENDVTSSMFSVIHEGGHALYELGADDRYMYTAIEGGVSMGVHESQSRFYENIIGRSREFVELIYPKMRECFKGVFDDVTPEEFWRAINKVTPSLIRTESDEVTYSLHIMIRYEIEKRMIAGDVTASEIPKLWNSLYKKYLSVDVPNDTNGALQDSHWSGGAIGYFPSYSIGSAYSAQQLHMMQKDFDVFSAVASGELCRVTEWLREKIHRHSSMYDPKPLMESVFKAPFDPKYYVDYLEKKTAAVYRL